MRKKQQDNSDIEILHGSFDNAPWAPTESTDEDVACTTGSTLFCWLPGNSTSYSFMERSRFATYVGKEEKEFGYPRDFEVRYELLEQLGKGGYGTVYKARERQTGEMFAVKVLEKEKLDTQQSLDRVRREVLYQSKMGPSLSVAYLHRVFEDADRVCMVMELCTGGPLWARIVDTEVYNEAQVAKIIKAALRAVAQCHARGIIIRDVKPHNFLFLNAREDSPLKLTDFGLGAEFRPDQIDVENFSERVGTSQYMAPEVVGRLTSWPPVPKYGPKADVWSVGIMAYQLLCGRLPFKNAPGKKDFTSADAFAAITLGALDFENEAWEKLSEFAKSLVRSLLQVETEDRPSARKALQHQWLRYRAASTLPLGDGLAADVVVSFDSNALQYLQRFGGYTHLKQAALQAIAPNLDEIQEERKKLSELFHLEDLTCGWACTSKQKVSPEYLQHALQEMGHDVQVSEANRILQSIDVTRRGAVETTGLMAAVTDWQAVQQEPLWDQWVEEAFDKFDTSGNGFLDETSLKAALGSSNSRFAAEAAKHDMSDVDTAKSGVITFAEFKQMLEKDDSELDDYDRRWIDFSQHRTD